MDSKWKLPKCSWKSSICIRYMEWVISIDPATWQRSWVAVSCFQSRKWTDHNKGLNLTSFIPRSECCQRKQILLKINPNNWHGTMNSRTISESTPKAERLKFPKQEVWETTLLTRTRSSERDPDEQDAWLITLLTYRLSHSVTPGAETLITKKISFTTIPICSSCLWSWGWNKLWKGLSCPNLWQCSPGLLVHLIKPTTHFAQNVSYWNKVWWIFFFLWRLFVQMKSPQFEMSTDSNHHVS